MRKRQLQSHLERFAKQYPVITLTGPRQSGKTTLCQSTFPKKKYVSLEDPDQRTYAIQDPRGFLKELEGGAIIDEFQRAPDLASYIQGIVDDKKQKGMFILTGSQNLAISQTVSQSLAGRTAVATLLPFSLKELQPNERKPIDELLIKGFYPRIYDNNLNPTEALNAYIATYVDRDVRQLKNIQDMNTFQRFLKLCAGRVGQLLNIDNLANETGTSHTTIKNWLSVLEATYILTTLTPYFKNFNKRIVKTPKLYFYDVGLASFLLGIQNAEQMKNSPFRGALFENLVVMDILKNQLHESKPKEIYFYRDSKGNEVDLLLNKAGKLLPIEIKSGATIQKTFFKGIEYFQKLTPTQSEKGLVIYTGNQKQNRTKLDVIPYTHLPDYFYSNF